MKTIIIKPSFTLIFCLVLFISCNSRTSHSAGSSIAQGLQSAFKQEPNYNYTLDPPENWIVYDTVMPDGLKIRFIKPTYSTGADNPGVNVLIAHMEGRDIDDFAERNISYIQNNRQGITLLESGHLDAPIYKGRWFTYIKEQNGTSRDMINYMIPLNGFAYMITCGVNKGSMRKYRPIFDRIAKSFKG